MKTPESRANAPWITSSLTHPGLKRSHNEDACLVDRLHDGSVLLAVADGLGGHAAGEVASAAAVDALQMALQEHCCDVDVLRAAFRKANESILEIARRDPARASMGTTLTACILAGHRGWWVHAGDSRICLLADGSLRQLTSDHTVPGLLLEDGSITREQASRHPMKHVLLNCLGRSSLELDDGAFLFLPGDIVLLSSDGLHDVVSAATLQRVLASAATLQDKLSTLLEAALAAGGPDNITLVAAQRPVESDRVPA